MSGAILSFAIAFATLFFVGGVYMRDSITKKYRQLPPGPSGIPLLGNVLQVPGRHLATYFRNLLEKYGGIVSLNLAGFPVILIGDIKLAKDLLDKHATKHSSRPIVPYVRYHVDPSDDYWASSRLGKTHTIARKLTAGVMSDVRAGKTEHLQEFEAILNLQHLLDDGGGDWFHHMERVAASTVLSAGFGLHCPTGHEPELRQILDVLNEIVGLLTPSASIINVLPFLDFIPGPMPWRTRAESFRKREKAIFKLIIDEAVTGKASGMNTWASAFAREDKPEGDQRRLVKMFSAAAIETTASSLHTFVLACIRYPVWMKTAQREIDKVVGLERLPSFKDRPSLPYVEAVVRGLSSISSPTTPAVMVTLSETLRWRPAVRFGIPHQSTESDVVEYKGKEYFIPEGSIIFPVAWAIEHDQSIFEDHDRFMPDRFLNADGELKPNYQTSAFGFGRRLCPGAPFAERSLWIDIATMLWTFNISGSKATDPRTGMPFKYDDSDAAFSGELTNAPLRFPAVFEPRSPQRAEVARREWAECEKDLNVLLPAHKDK